MIVTRQRRNTMITNKLLDEHEDVNYFVYLTNRPDAFPKISDSLKEIYTNLREEVSMGYTDLWVLRRIGIVSQDNVFYFPEKDQLTGEERHQQYLPDKKYITFTFIQINQTSPMYAGGIMTHLTYEEAKDFAIKNIEERKQKYPEREFYVLCARLVETNMWH